MLKKPIVFCATALLCTVVFAGSDFQLAAVGVLRSGELIVLDSVQGLRRLSTRGRSNLVNGFGPFQANDLATVSIAGSDAVFVSLQIRHKSPDPFTRLRRIDGSGRTVSEWSLRVINGVLAGVAVDHVEQVAYCSDSRLGTIYKISLRQRDATFANVASVRNAGVLGPIVFDARRRRVVVADVENARILSINPQNGAIETLLERGPLVEPVALAFDSSHERIYIADGARRRVWSASAGDRTLRLTPFAPSHKFDRPVGIIFAPDGRTVWIADRGARTLYQFGMDGRRVGQITP